MASNIQAEIQHLSENKFLIDMNTPYLYYAPENIEPPANNVEVIDVDMIPQKTERDMDDDILAEEPRIQEEIAEMRRLGQWSTISVLEGRKSGKKHEPDRNKTHWDFVLGEMEWLANDFKEERKWKMINAKKNVRAVARHHITVVNNEKRKKKDEEHQVRKLAKSIAKLVKKDFWSKIEKIVSLKRQSKIEETKQKFMDEKRDYLVEQTEKFSMMLSAGLSSPMPQTPKKMETEEEEDDEVLSEDEDEDVEPATPQKPQTDTSTTEQQRISAASESAMEFQPTGTTLETTNVKTTIPFLLSPNLKLREYQHIGLDWLITMYERGLNGILADEMGLGKTIQTISLLAHLACEKQIWGPHLIVAPASVLLNWEIELKRWCPSFKILSYYGSLKERKNKRNGWSKPNAFHICITSYNLVVQDHNVFRRKKWHYLILDEAHHIKNFKSQCWQSLLNFNTNSRLLLTGTPLQNNVMELWSLMHFLMPQIFQSHSEFKEWFSKPVTGMVEGTHDINEKLITRLHSVLRPFLLRRLKKDVEKQLPQKTEHVLEVKLSKRQRLLYEEFMSKADTQSILISGNIFKIINVLMQLRKVCNHPDLFEPRPIVSPFDADNITMETSNMVSECNTIGLWNTVDLDFLGLRFIQNEFFGRQNSQTLKTQSRPDGGQLLQFLHRCERENPESKYNQLQREQQVQFRELQELRLPPEVHMRAKQLAETKMNNWLNTLKDYQYQNTFKCHKLVMLDGVTLERVCHVPTITRKIQKLEVNEDGWKTMLDFYKTPQQRLEEMDFIIENFVCIIPRARANPHQLVVHHQSPSIALENEMEELRVTRFFSPLVEIYRRPFVRTQMYFPDKRLLQYDCGKLQKMAVLLRELKQGGHRVLIFTQMSKMLNILEQFLSMHNHTYFRLDGATKIERRQYMMERFNTDPKIFCFILSTRSGGLGINLTGADTVIFYDSDWNPAMDAQAQDRCHRIGQTKDVRIYRLISEKTVEERILLKANQKRAMNELVIHSGGFTPDFLKKMDVRDFFGDEQVQDVPAPPTELENLSDRDVERMLAGAEDESDVQALKQAHKEEDEMYKEFGEAERDETTQVQDSLLGIEKYVIFIKLTIGLHWTIWKIIYHTRMKMSLNKHVKKNNAKQQTLKINWIVCNRYELRKNQFMIKMNHSRQYVIYTHRISRLRPHHRHRLQRQSPQHHHQQEKHELAKRQRNEN